jgi:hypothetical protein
MRGVDCTPRCPPPPPGDLERCGGAGPFSGGHYARDCPQAATAPAKEAERRAALAVVHGAEEEEEEEGPGSLEETAARFRALNKKLKRQKQEEAKAAKARRSLDKRNARRKRGRDRAKVRKQELQKGWNAKRAPAKKKPTAKR